MIWLILAICVAGFLAYGQSSKRASRRSGRKEQAFFVPEESIRVDISLPHPPIIAGGKSRPGSNIPDAMKPWMMAEIAFSFANRSRLSRPIILEKMNVELYLFADLPSRETTSPRWFVGTQTLHAVVFDPTIKSRRYWASLFLPPAYVYMCLPRDRSGKYDLANLIGMVVLSDQEGNVLGWKTFSGRGKLPAARAKKLTAAVSEIRTKKIDDSIRLWPREKTPWQWLDADRFELPLTDFNTKPPEASRQPTTPASTDGVEE